MIVKEYEHLIIKQNRSNVELHMYDEDRANCSVVKYRIAPEIPWLKFLKSSAEKIWKDFEPKEADSISSDYDEFYDSKTGFQGGLRIDRDKKALVFEVPDPDGDLSLLYRFNKRKMESFIYDLEELGYLKKQKGAEKNEFK